MDHVTSVLPEVRRGGEREKVFFRIIDLNLFRKEKKMSQRWFFVFDQFLQGQRRIPLFSSKWKISIETYLENKNANFWIEN